ncbi:MAG: hypothetical protein L3J93_05565 [Thermoplasmata archaeon]|nr:hypothetical protein [Thermoplasmata archaeon]
MSDPARPLDIPLPKRLDRRMRLGPFPSARDALKFAAYAAIGTTVLPIGGAAAWLPFLVAGFLLATYRPDGKGLDERAADYLRWQRRKRFGRIDPGAPDARSPRSEAGARDGRVAAEIFEVGGLPLRFLPPRDARELFEAYRALLRSLAEDVYLDASTVPIPATPFRLPTLQRLGAEEAGARAGYAELLSLLLRRRRRRRVRIALLRPPGTSGGPPEVDDRSTDLRARLGSFGLDPIRLAGVELRRALSDFGWNAGGLR